MQIPGKYSLRINNILDYIAQEEIFKLVLGSYPDLGEQYCSPFRVDSNPGCYFYYDSRDRLKFVDWGNTGNTHIDCFEAVKLFFKLDNYVQVIHLIYDALVDGRKIERVQESQVKKKERKKTFISVHKKQFSKEDQEYWNKFGITEENLEEDQVYPIDKIYINSQKGESVFYPRRELAYADTNFPSGHKKVYFPNRKGQHKMRFLTNCTQNDIGNLNNIDYSQENLVITKSHKDHRVLKNLGYHNTVYLSNEGQVPEPDILSKLISTFKKIFIFFDNDLVGYNAAEYLKQKILDIKSSIEIFIVRINFTKTKDIAELFALHGKQVCQEFTNKNIYYVPNTLISGSS